MSKLQKSIGAGEFKKKCLNLFDEVQKNKYSIVITKYRKPVAEVVPIQKDSIPLFGALKGLLSISKDIIKPIDETWEVENNIQVL